jgi:hypothetical protein
LRWRDRQVNWKWQPGRCRIPTAGALGEGVSTKGI